MEPTTASHHISEWLSHSPLTLSLVGVATALLGLAIAAALLGLLLLLLHDHKPAGVPGPGRELPVLNSLFWILAYRRHMLGILTELFQRLGDHTTYTAKWPGSPRFFFVSNPACVEHVLKTRFNNYVKGNLVHRNLADLLGSGIFTVDGDQWRLQRKIASHMFSLREFRDTIMTALRHHADELDSVLASHAASGAELDMQRLFYRFTLDAIGEIAFGEDLGALRCPEGVPFSLAFDMAQGIVEQRFVSPGWQLLEHLDGTRTQLRRNLRTIETFCADLIRRRRDSGEYRTRHDLLSRLMAEEDELGKPLYRHNDTMLRDVILNFMIAGRDTTAQALSWALYCIATSPSRASIETRLRSEAVGLLGASAPLAPSAGPGPAASAGARRPAAPALVTYDETAHQLCYSAAVVSETLRLYPSVPKDLKVAVEDDVLPDGTPVRAGQAVCWVPYAMGRLTANWGKDACEFKPERFLSSGRGSDGGESLGEGRGADGAPPSLPLRYSPFLFASFNAGPRSCLGQNMAMVEASLVLAVIHRKYQLEMVPGQNITYAETLTLPQQEGIRCTVRMRD